MPLQRFLCFSTTAPAEKNKKIVQLGKRSGLEESLPRAPNPESVLAVEKAKLSTVWHR
jgi:hypothetical protein